MYDYHSSYLRNIFKPKQRKERVNKVALTIKRQVLKLGLSLEDVTIVGTGISGTAIGSMLAAKLGTKLSILRKEGESSHGNVGFLESSGKIDNYVVVDDFVDTGATFERIKEGVEKRYVGARLLFFAGFNEQVDKENLERKETSYSKTIGCPVYLTL